MAKIIGTNKTKESDLLWKPNAQATAAELRQHAEARLRGRLRTRLPVAPGQNAETDNVGEIHEWDVNQLELELQNNELRRARDELELGYVCLDEEGLILDMNLAGAMLLGLGRSRLIDRCLAFFMPPSYRPIFRAFLKTAFTGVALPDCEILLLKEGGSFWAGFTATSASSGKDDRKHCRFCFSDITARRQSTELSSRELEVLRLIAAGKANKQIASELVISMRTVEKHRAHLMEKLDIHDTAGLTRHAMDSGIMTDVTLPTMAQSSKPPASTVHPNFYPSGPALSPFVI